MNAPSRSQSPVQSPVQSQSAASQRIASALMLPVALLALIASAMGILQPSLYQEAVASGQITKFLLMGSVVQDMISLPAALVLAACALACLRRECPRTFAAMLGLAAYFFYGYALYSIQGQYTRIYPLYLAILSLSLFGLVYGLAALLPTGAAAPVPPNGLRLAIAVFLTVILAVLVPAWLGRMAPDIARRIAGEVYGVFVLDLAIVFPAFAIIAFRLYASRPSGTLPAAIALVKTFTLCLSVALGEWIKPVYGFEQDPAMIGIFTVLTVISAVLGIWLLRWLGRTRQAG